jgi:hypothetical protein
MTLKFDPHLYPKRSRLEKWRDEISEMRALNWPCAKIVRWLLEHHHFEITDEGVRQFCIRRGILKGGRIVPVLEPTKPKRGPVVMSLGTPKGRSKTLFDYDDSRPIDRWGGGDNSTASGS